MKYLRITGSIAAAILFAGLIACSSGGLRLAGTDEAVRGPSLVPLSRDYYPPIAKETGLGGRVGLECAVDGRGYAQDIVILESGGLVLDDAARRLFAEGHFLIPTDWSATGGPAKRFRYGVIFQLKGKPAVASFGDRRLSVMVAG